MRPTSQKTTIVHGKCTQQLNDLDRKLIDIILSFLQDRNKDAVTRNKTERSVTDKLTQKSLEFIVDPAYEIAESK